PPRRWHGRALGLARDPRRSGRPDHCDHKLRKKGYAMRFPLLLLSSLAMAVPLALSCQSSGSGAGKPSGSDGGSFARMPPNPQYLKQGESRTFAIEYTSQIKDIPAGTKQLRLWVPVPQDTPVQSIKDLRFEGKQPQLTTEKKFGNKLAYWVL